MQRSEIEKKMKGRGKYNTIVIKKMCDGGKNLRVINNMLNTLNLNNTRTRKNILSSTNYSEALKCTSAN